MGLDLEPLRTFLEEDTSPKDLAELLDGLLFDYMIVLTKLQLSNHEDKTIHEDTDQFLFFLKRLRDVLLECER